MKNYIRHSIIMLLIAVACGVTSCTDELILSVDDVKSAQSVEEISDDEQPNDSIRGTEEVRYPIGFTIEVEPIKEEEIIFEK